MANHLERAVLLIQQRRGELAEQELALHLAAEPEHAYAHALLATCRMMREDAPGAMNASARAIALSPDDPYAHYVRAAVLQHFNHFDEAALAAKTALDLDPHNPDVYGVLAQIDYSRERFREALKWAEGGLAVDPEHAVCVNLRSMLLVRAGRWDDAEKTMESVLKRTPQDPWAHANEGWRLLHEGDHKQAMVHFREALRIDPSLDWAREGILESMRARNPLYRGMMTYFLWMQRLDRRARWGVILGGYIGFRILQRLGRTYPQAQLFVLPLIVAYIAFALATWLARPLSNLVLRLDRFGRYALSDEDRRVSNMIGACLLVVALGVVAGFGFLAVDSRASEPCFFAAVVGAGLMLPASSFYGPVPGWPRKTLWSYLAVQAAIGSLAIVGAAIYAATGRQTGEWIALLVFVIGAVLGTFVTNILVSVRPRPAGRSKPPGR